MKLQSEKREIEGFGGDHESTFKITPSAKAFKILSDSLYKNNIRAIIRELSCNALDSHVAAGKADVPFEIHLPTQIEPYFAVQDFGVGLSHDEVTSVYTTYFESTKTDSNEFVGALGLGSKSPFSYTDAFTVVSVKDGIKSIYSAFLNAEGTPAIKRLHHEETDLPNGVRVEVPLKKGQNLYEMRTWVEQALEVFRPFTVRPKITTHDDAIPDYKFVKKDITKGVHLLSRNSNIHETVVVMGNIEYKVDFRILEQKVQNLYEGDIEKIRDFQQSFRFLSQDTFLLEFDLGELEFAPSREELHYTEYTIKNIKDRVDEVANNIKKYVMDEFLQIKNPWEIIELAEKFEEETTTFPRVVNEALEELEGKLPEFDYTKINQFRAECKAAYDLIEVHVKEAAAEHQRLYAKATTDKTASAEDVAKSYALYETLSWFRNRYSTSSHLGHFHDENASFQTRLSSYPSFVHDYEEQGVSFRTLLFGRNSWGDRTLSADDFSRTFEVLDRDLKAVQKAVDKIKAASAAGELTGSGLDRMEKLDTKVERMSSVSISHNHTLIIANDTVTGILNKLRTLWKENNQKFIEVTDIESHSAVRGRHTRHRRSGPGVPMIHTDASYRKSFASKKDLQDALRSIADRITHGGVSSGRVKLVFTSELPDVVVSRGSTPALYAVDANDEWKKPEHGIDYVIDDARARGKRIYWIPVKGRDEVAFNYDGTDYQHMTPKRLNKMVEALLGHSNFVLVGVRRNGIKEAQDNKKMVGLLDGVLSPEGVKKFFERTKAVVNFAEIFEMHHNKPNYGMLTRFGKYCVHNEATLKSYMDKIDSTGKLFELIKKYGMELYAESRKDRSTEVSRMVRAVRLANVLDYLPEKYHEGAKHANKVISETNKLTKEYHAAIAEFQNQMQKLSTNSLIDLYAYLSYNTSNANIERILNIIAADTQFTNLKRAEENKK